MPSFNNPQMFGIDWVEAWNSRDIEAILAHYADDVEFTSPRVASRHQQSGVGDASGKLVGKVALRKYFQEALDTVHDLQLDLQDVLVGADGVCLVYTRETGAKVAERFKFDSSGLVASVEVYYDLVC